jgi:lysozyme family protein
MKASLDTKLDIAALVLFLEGKWSDDPRDLGGIHRWGISSRYHPEANDPDFSLTEALEVYENYILECKLLNIMVASRSREVGYQHFNFCFNVGSKRGMELFQAALFISPEMRDLKIDGLYGPRTEAALITVISSIGTDAFVERLSQMQAGWYMGHAGSTSQNHYRLGWMNRVTRSMAAFLANREELRDQLSGILSREDTMQTRVEEA